ncbi:M4 family metallopeptidase [Lysobacter sp. K5869]|nr:M4 family metallopeptidase [Lysobacter sp. K5869]
MIDTASRPGARQAWASSSPKQADASAAAERARQLLATAGAREVNLVKNDGFNARDVMIDRDGTEHVRMERSYEGLPVVGGDMVVHSRNGELLSVTQGGNMRTTARPRLKPDLSAAQARTEAGAQFDGRVTQLSPAKLVVYARNGIEPTLAYQVDLRGARNDSQDPGVVSYFLDARNGSVLQAEDRYETAAANGTGKTLTMGNVGIVADSTGSGYRLVDVSRGGAETIDIFNKTGSNDADLAAAKIFTDADNVWGNNAKSDRATAAADVHYGVAATWDYFKTVHGRTGIDNNGSAIKAYVHFSTNYFNAGATTLTDADGNFVSYAMIYGDGDWSNGNTPVVALDVAGHEMAHLFNGASANLGYYDVKDSGGLNEGNSDIFGALVEFSANNAKDPGDWLIGENIYPPSSFGTPKALRRMFDQANDGTSINCYPAGGFSGADTAKGGRYDPHFTSGVTNRFAYLLSQGAVTPKGFTSYTPAKLVCNTDTAIVGIGPAKLGAIWYRAMTKYFVSSTDYPGARAGTLQAATDLYGADSTEYKTVARAWSAAGVN